MPQPKKQKPSKLKLETCRLLRNRPATLTLRDVAEATQLSEFWVKSFHVRGDKFDAGVDNVAVLYEYLSGKKLIEDSSVI